MSQALHQPESIVVLLLPSTTLVLLFGGSLFTLVHPTALTLIGHFFFPLLPYMASYPSRKSYRLNPWQHFGQKNHFGVVALGEVGVDSGA
jgi:hypothetical protein